MKSTDPVRYEVGDKITITQNCLRRMRDSNRSSVTPNYPSDSFISMAAECLGAAGEVTHTFQPGYEITARFGDRYFHMKDNWVEMVK